MSKKKLNQICRFTDTAAQVSYLPKSSFINIISDACGRYMISSSVYDQVDKVEIYFDRRQNILNCARHCIELSTQSKFILPLWVTRSEKDSVQNSISKFNQEVKLCIFEDYLTEDIDHSLKPIDLLKSFSERLKQNEAFTKFNANERDRAFARIVDTEREVLDFLCHLRDQKFIKLGIFTLGSTWKNVDINMTMEGWSKLREEQLNQKSNKVFIAMQFSWPKPDDILHSKVVDSIRKACSSLGYDANLVDQFHTGNISDKIIAEIKKSRFLIAELTYNNRGVYFESGFARGLGINVYHVIKEGFTKGNESKGRKIHFDIQQLMYREWKTPEMLEEQLKDWILSTIGSYR